MNEIITIKYCVDIAADTADTADTTVVLHVYSNEFRNLHTVFSDYELVFANTTLLEEYGNANHSDFSTTFPIIRNYTKSDFVLLCLATEIKRF